MHIIAVVDVQQLTPTVAVGIDDAVTSGAHTVDVALVAVRLLLEAAMRRRVLGQQRDLVQNLHHPILGGEQLIEEARILRQLKGHRPNTRAIRAAISSEWMAPCSSSRVTTREPSCPPPCSNGRMPWSLYQASLRSQRER